MVRLFHKISRLQPGESAQTAVTTIHYELGVRWKRLLPAFGAVVTGIVLVALVVTKFVEGAWIVVLAIPLLVLLFRNIHQHYDHVAEQLSTDRYRLTAVPDIANVVIIPIGDVHQGTLRAIQYARRLTDNVRAVYISTSASQKARLQARWNDFPISTEGVALTIVDYEYRDILTPLVDCIHKVKEEEYSEQMVTVVVPEFVPDSLWAHLLHNQTANLLRARLRQYEDVVVIDVPYHLHE